VLIHGTSVNLRDMKLALGDALSTRHRVVIVDRPGRGYSSRPADGWRLKRQAEILHAALGELGVERPVVVGQSLGGAVALAYALEYQDEMTGLVLLAPVSHEWPGGIAWYNRVSQWPIAGALFRRLVLPIYAPLAANSGVANTFAPDAPPEGYAEATGLALLFRPADFKSNAADIARLKPQVAAMSRRYREIRIPTAILAGASDRTVSPHIHARALARDIPGATLQILPETGHALHHAQTARVAAAIESVAD
jgi:pimeloyl-ACP methyl ester carboxylesterase